jgi:hypothetical protein
MRLWRGGHRFVPAQLSYTSEPQARLKCMHNYDGERPAQLSSATTLAVALDGEHR